MSREIYRFSPSPTNLNEFKNEELDKDGIQYPLRGAHQGSLRTVLFNYILKQQNPDNLLFMRIEDTDLERSNEDSVLCLIRDLEWAEIQFDAGFTLKNGKAVEFNNTDLDLGPLRQTQRLDIYHNYAKILLDKDLAYIKDGATYFKLPRKEIIFKDEVLGMLRLPPMDCKDFVIIKSSGVPSFYFAVTIDDELMGITTIIRGQEHINTAYRQIALQKALGFRTIKMAHIPLIANPDGSKMSKRQKTGQVLVHDFRKDGYLPDVMLMYLSNLGWGSGEVESKTMEEVIKNFKLGDINRRMCRFDYKKLLNFNYSSLTTGTFERFCLEAYEYGMEFYPNLIKKINEFDTPNRSYFTDIMMGYYGRTKILKDVFENLPLFVEEKREIVADGMEGIEGIEEFIEGLGQIEEWTAENIEKEIYKFLAAKNLKMKNFHQKLRLQLTGVKVSPPIHKTLFIFGKEECLKRLGQLTLV